MKRIFAFKKLLVVLLMCLVDINGFSQDTVYGVPQQRPIYVFYNINDVEMSVTMPVKHSNPLYSYKMRPHWDYLGELTSVIQFTEHYTIGHLNLLSCNIRLQEYSKAYHAKFEIPEWDYTTEHIKAKIYPPTEAVVCNYMIGLNCTRAGRVMVSVGVPITFIGAVCLGTGMGMVGSTGWRGVRGERLVKAGTGLLIAGGTCITVSILLFCWGDHIRRECNMVISK